MTELSPAARAALAEPEPEGPTREDAVAVYSQVMAAHQCETLGEMAEHFARAVLARWGRPMPAPKKSPTVMQIIELAEEMDAKCLGQIDFARAVLARWGNSAIATELENHD